MNIRQRISNFLVPTQKNSVGAELAADFMRYGVRTPAMPDWHWEMLDEREKYTGYLYGAIIRRANKVAWLATYNLRTGANEKLSESAKAENAELSHPYLDLIDESPTFANDQFWREIQTFIDLRGVYYLLVVRGKVGEILGGVKEFKLLNPYNIIEVWNNENMEIIGYTESLEGMSREIPPHMIIRIKPLNPFSKIKPWSLADAATSAQYGLKETMDQVTTGSRRNRKYPGVIMLGGNNVALDPEQVQNWKARMAGKGRDGEPMFASAAGANGSASDIKWNDMQVDMRKSDIKAATDIQINALSAVTGLSKTKFGIEQSGTTRDTAAIQDDLFVTDHAMPALQLVIDALNQDYKTMYPKDYKTNGYFMHIESPLGEDKDAELTAVTNRINTFDLYQSLLDKGYDPQSAAKYSMGDKDVDELGQPTGAPKDVPDTPPAHPQPDPPIEPPIKATPGHSLQDRVFNRRIPIPKGSVRCKCCDGYGIHVSGYRCERCRGTAAVKPNESHNSSPCAGAIHASASLRTELAVNQVALTDFPGLLDDVDMVPDDLGCIMLNTEPVAVKQHVEDADDDLADPEDDDDIVVPGEDESHITLLYGLLENGNTWKNKVDTVLNGWNPGKLTIDKVGSFDLGDKHAIVAHIKKTPELVDGHERLTLLPHIQTFSEYAPHMTLVYVKHDQGISDKWVNALGKQYNGKPLKSKDINYGHPPKTGSNNAFHHGHDHLDIVPVITNSLSTSDQDALQNQQAALRNAIINVEHQMVSTVLNKVTTNDFSTKNDIMGEGDQQKYEHELEKALAAFYDIVIPIAGNSTMARRLRDLGKLGTFSLDAEAQRYIRVIATKASASHVETVLGDILNTIRTTEERLIQGEMKTITAKPGQTPEDVLAEARRLALEGPGRQQLVAAITQKYSDTISTTRATTIARTETARAFNRAQFEADRQFLSQNDLTSRAYKQWVTRSSNPCPYCTQLAGEPPIPFTQDFASVGDVLQGTVTRADGTTVTQQMPVSFEDISSGNAHPNCQCTYQLIIE